MSAVTATLQGQTNRNGNPVNVSFQWGLTVAYGNTTVPRAITTGSGNQTFNQVLSGLADSTTYHYRSKVESSFGTINGADQSFVTPDCGAGIPWLFAGTVTRYCTPGFTVPTSDLYALGWNSHDDTINIVASGCTNGTTTGCGGIGGPYTVTSNIFGATMYKDYGPFVTNKSVFISGTMLCSPMTPSAGHFCHGQALLTVRASNLSGYSGDVNVIVDNTVPPYSVNTPFSITGTLLAGTVARVTAQPSCGEPDPAPITMEIHGTVSVI